LITHIHHINFLVRDLDLAVQRYQGLLGDTAFEYGELPSRAVKTARVKLAQTWLILIQPLDKNSVPAIHLAKHGEGFFMLSFATDDLASVQHRIENSLDLIDNPFDGPVRTGLDGWQVLDFQMKHLFGAQMQLTEDNS